MRNSKATSCRAARIIYGPNCLKGVVHGDVEKGFAEADVITEGTFGYENIPNALPAESVGAVAIWEPPNKATIWGTSQAPYMDKVTLFHVFNRQVEIRSIGQSCRRRLRDQDHVLAGAGLRNHPGPRDRPAREGDVHQRRTHGCLHPAAQLAHSREGRDEKRRRPSPPSRARGMSIRATTLLPHRPRWRSAPANS